MRTTFPLITATVAAACLFACSESTGSGSGTEQDTSSTSPSDASSDDDAGSDGTDTEDIAINDAETPEDTQEADAAEPEPDAGPVEPPPGELKVTEVVTGLTRPWAMDFLPNGHLLVTLRTGELRRVDTSDWSVSGPLAGVPEVWFAGQGGLLDVLVDPDFENNSTIYLTYSEAGDGGSASTAAARAVLTDSGLTDVTKIFTQLPKVTGPNHFGSRLQFDPTGALMLGLGERFDYMDDSQTLDNHMGKVVRINPDGTIPSDNPFFDDSSALPEIWSYGHRNIQGMAVHPTTGAVYVHEHGPEGGDEVNRPEAGQNYGWPLACYGDHYWGTVIPDDHAGQGFTEPLHYWTPSIAPSGMTFYDGDEFPHWRGNLFVGALVQRHLARLVMDGDEVVEEERLLEDLNARMRAVEQGPDGALYVLTDDATNGTLLRLTWE